LYEVRHNGNILKVGIGKSEDVMMDGQNRRAYTSARIAGKQSQYEGANPRVITRHNGITKGEMKEIEAKRVRDLRAAGHELPLNRERDKRYEKKQNPQNVDKNKKNKPIVIMAAEIPGIDDFANMDSIEEKLNNHIEFILPKINIEDLSGWNLKFYINSMCTDFIGVLKKFRRYPSEMEYEIPVVIAIPDNSQAFYGIPPAEDGRIGYFHPGNERYSHLLEPEYEKYKNLDQYILNSAIKAINVGFTKGFACKGKTIKFQNM